MTQTPTSGNNVSAEEAIRKQVRTCTDDAVLNHFLSRISFVSEVLGNFPIRVYPPSEGTEQVKQEVLTLLTALEARGLIPPNVLLPGSGNALQTSHTFYTGFQAALFMVSQFQPLSDADLVRTFARVVARQDRDDAWRVGYLAGLFAWLYDVPYRWAMGETEHTFEYRLMKRTTS